MGSGAPGVLEKNVLVELTLVCLECIPFLFSMVHLERNESMKFQ
jgi:hypothetical protein